MEWPQQLLQDCWDLDAQHSPSQEGEITRLKLGSREALKGSLLLSCPSGPVVSRGEARWVSLETLQVLRTLGGR